jgi:outer membrane lipoprotein-sorting protein
MWEEGWMLMMTVHGTGKRGMGRYIFVIFLFILFFASTVRAQEGIDIETWVDEAEAVLSRTESYTAVFHKRERIQGRLRREETILFKFKKPFKIYMKWIERPYRGRELIYVEGRNDNRIKAHEGGFLGFINVNLDPMGSKVMRDNRHPITESGLENLVNLIAGQVRRGMEEGEFESRDLGEENVYGRATSKVEGIFPRDERKGYYCYRTVVNVDIEAKVPIKILIYDWDDDLIESYGYEDLKLNAGLTEEDFNPESPEYKF